ncbi:hypothetical protein KFL_008630030 [Klebsormidium nitens]|uniref:Uncharacterized protein n=1 Tax=Klebsormidium nitens TaxID=105231 RepID=A0A1Y1ILR2_KLENI|nr:hypothetical protein KFL_008630030 [Klebsormidium nitens]|eukprot:GAQ91825.1 hypothetical protein KFL_008630030 [Klebsormidium nitens]
MPRKTRNEARAPLKRLKRVADDVDTDPAGGSLAEKENAGSSCEDPPSEKDASAPDMDPKTAPGLSTYEQRMMKQLKHLHAPMNKGHRTLLSPVRVTAPRTGSGDQQAAAEHDGGRAPSTGRANGCTAQTDRPHNADQLLALRQPMRQNEEVNMRMAHLKNAAHDKQEQVLLKAHEYLMAQFLTPKVINAKRGCVAIELA